jgi:hypothetical protein
VAAEAAPALRRLAQEEVERPEAALGVEEREDHRVVADRHALGRFGRELVEEVLRETAAVELQVLELAGVDEPPRLVGPEDELVLPHDHDLAAGSGRG